MKSKDDNFKIRDRQGGNRYFIDNAFLKTWGAKLGPHCIAVYNVLVMFANSDDQTAYPSFQTIADLTGMSRRQVVREIDKLKANNIIQTERRPQTHPDTGKPYFLTDIFTLMHPDKWANSSQSLCEPSDTQSLGVETDSHQPSDTQSPPLVTHSHPNKTNLNKTQLTTPNGVVGKPTRPVKDKTLSAPLGGKPPGPLTKVKEAFEELTNLKTPTARGESKAWWGWYGQILEAGGKDADRAIKIMRTVIKHMDAAGLAINKPKSIVDSCRAVAAGRSLGKNGSYTNGYPPANKSSPPLSTKEQEALKRLQAETANELHDPLNRS